MDTLKDTTMQHVTDVTIAEIKRAAEHPAKAPVIVRADTMLGVIERIEQFESDLATAEQDSRQKQARIDRLEAAEKDIALKERVIDSLGVILTAVVNERDELRATMEKIADWYGAWGPYPETNKSWCAMAIVTAREAVKPLTNLCAKGEGK